MLLLCLLEGTSMLNGVLVQPQATVRVLLHLLLLVLQHDDFLLALLFRTILARGPGGCRADRLGLEHLGVRFGPGRCLLRDQLLQAARDTLLLLVPLVAGVAAPSCMVLVVASFSGRVLRDAVWGAHAGASRRVMGVQSLLGRGLRVGALAYLLMGVFDGSGLGRLLGGKWPVTRSQYLLAVLLFTVQLFLFALLYLNI